ncbi:MAG: MbnP family protein [Saprospiraceae bacterium]
MRKFLLFLVLGLWVASCKDDDIGPTTTVNLNFKATYDGRPLVFTDSVYVYPDGHLIKFDRLNFFISDIALLEAQGSGEAGLIDIGFLNFSDNSTLPEAETPLVVSNNKVPVGQYKAIRIGIGVPASLNRSSSTTLPTGNPLRDNAGEFWSDWDSYIFLKSEGKFDADGSGQFGDGPKEGFGHHPGTDEVYRSITFTHPIVLEEGKPFDLNFVLDILKLYVKDGVALDLTKPENLDTQSPSDLELAKFLMNNLLQALALEK